MAMVARVADSVRLINPNKIRPNPENPRLIFREEDLLALERSIETQGILVPLTVYEGGAHFIILDGERRWRCARKLALGTVPAHVQKKPDQLQNIMMMFAIHQARSDWDPLPTAMKLQQLSDVLETRYGREPSESELAAAASLSRGEVRRYRRILELPDKFRSELMRELEKPRSKQVLTVDHVLEAVRGAGSMAKREVIDQRQETRLTESLVDKFRHQVLTSTVEPRLLPKMARAVERGDLTARRARNAVERLIDDPAYTVVQAYKDTVETADFEHGSVQIIERLILRLEDHRQRHSQISDELRMSLAQLQKLIRALLASGGG
jgi:ParB/RepB/Spo0J family partition protein